MKTTASDVERAKNFYEGLGWRLDADFPFDNGFRVVQLTPPGSACSVQFGMKRTSAAVYGRRALSSLALAIAARSLWLRAFWDVLCARAGDTAVASVRLASSTAAVRETCGGLVMAVVSVGGDGAGSDGSSPTIDITTVMPGGK